MSTGSGRPEPSGAPILVADDDRDILDFLCLCLEREGYRPIPTGDGAEALEAVRRRPPVLAIIDMMMPQLSGPEVVRALRREPSTASLPVIVITARVAEADVAEALAAGADECLTKPFTPRELTARVAELLAR